MDSSNYAFFQGVRDTRGALERWNRDPWPVLKGWLIGSLLVGVGMLLAVWGIGSLTTPQPGTGTILAGFNAPASISDVGRILVRNSLVLAQHKSTFMRGAHDHIGRAAIVFVVCATTFSLVTQSLAIGQSASTLAFTSGISVGTLLLGLLPHALPELTALFLPLAAWIIASRRGDWHDLLAATFVTTALAAPVLIVAAFVEVFVSPHLLLALRG